MKIIIILKILFGSLFLFISLSACAIEEPSVQEGAVLSLDECVSVAINNSPVIKGKAYNLQVAISNVGIAKSAYFPNLGYDAGIYQDYNSNKNYNGSSNRELPQVNVYLSQLLWNFGKTNSIIRMERFYKLASEYEFLDSICNTIYDVKIHYYALLKAQSEVEIAKNNVYLNEDHLTKAHELSLKDKNRKADYTNAKINLSEAKILLLDAQNNYDLALADLANSLYIAPAPEFSIQKVDTFNFSDVYMPESILTKPTDDKNIIDVALKTKIEKNETSKIKKLPYTMNDSFSIAEKNSPDLSVLDATLSAMKQSLIAVKRQYFPDLTGNVGYGFNNTREYSNSSLMMSVNMSANDIEKFRQNLYFAVKKAFLNVLRSEKQVKSSEQKLIQSKENFDLVNSAYNDEEADYIAYQKAREDFNNSKIHYVKMLYEYNTSLANLEIAMHTHVDNLHERAEHAMQYHYKDLLKKLDASLECDGHEHEHIDEPEN